MTEQIPIARIGLQHREPGCSRGIERELQSIANSRRPALARRRYSSNRLQRRYRLELDRSKARKSDPSHGMMFRRLNPSAYCAIISSAPGAGEPDSRSTDTNPEIALSSSYKPVR